MRLCLYHWGRPNFWRKKIHFVLLQIYGYTDISSAKWIQFPAMRGGGNCIFTVGLGTFGAVIGKSTLPSGSNENLLTIRYFLGKCGRSKHGMLMLPELLCFFPRQFSLILQRSFGWNNPPIARTMRDDFSQCTGCGDWKLQTKYMNHLCWYFKDFVCVIACCINFHSCMTKVQIVK